MGAPGERDCGPGALVLGVSMKKQDWLIQGVKIQPEHIRRTAMNDYARLQILKLIVTVVILIIVAVYHLLKG